MTSRSDFASRIRTQLQARYGAVEISIHEQAFAIQLKGAGIDSRLPLSPLFRACEKDPDSTPRLIAEWVSSVESHLTPQTSRPYEPSRLLWCVRSEAYMQELGGRDLLLTRKLGGELEAFVAESLPGSIMRGIPTFEVEQARDDPREVGMAADVGTHNHFADLAARLERSTRVPADGWKLSSDSLYAGSVLLCSAVLQRLVALASGPILLANPDRALSMAIAVGVTGAPTFAETILDLWRQSMNPSSSTIFWSDGVHLFPLQRRDRKTSFETWVGQHANP